MSMEGYRRSKLTMNFSDASRATATSIRSPKRALGEKQALRGQMFSQQQSLRESYHRSQNSIRSLLSELSWTEGYSKFLEDLDGEESLNGSPILKSHYYVEKSHISKRDTRKKPIGKMANVGMEVSYDFTLKI